jgi:hypothetical protein
MQNRRLIPINSNLLSMLLRRPLNIGVKMRCIDRTLTIEYRTALIESPFLNTRNERSVK